jgi:SAM-dependent methyltransferase
MSDRIAFWDERATLGATAGTQDLGLVQLERRAIQRHVRPDLRVLDVGCGTGDTLATLTARTRRGVDFSPHMVEAARAKGLDVQVGSVLDADLGEADLVYTQRCLINLTTWDEQRAAIRRLAAAVAPGGTLLLVEHYQDGLDALNDERLRWGLPRIDPPWHNRYIQHTDVVGALPGLERQATAVDFSWRYYYVSRVITAWDAQQRGEAPAYDAPINLAAAAIDEPGYGPSVGQARWWRWVRPATS